MAIQFHKLEVEKIIRRTKDAVSVFFKVPNETKELWNYKSGQYLTLKFDIYGNSERRAYSLSTSPIADTDFGVTVKEVDGGKVSSYINNTLKVGDIVDVMPPLGSFTTDLNSNNSPKYFMWAGGSGITPIISLIKSIEKVQQNSKIKLLYANQSVDSIIFKDELEELSNNENISITHILEKDNDDLADIIGRITPNICSEQIKKNPEFLNAEHFMCGPAGMMDQITEALNVLNISKNLIHKELFTASENQDKLISKDSANSEENAEPVKSEVTVMIYGEEHTITVEPDETILQAGIRQNLDPPFSCQIAACATCQAKVLDGKIEMEADDALTEDEIEDGYVLTCVSHPLTSTAKIDYDY
ncbi:ferredoxin--NADP reductase [Candidatus Kapabacteria bacterium]|nr:ferredoxin--NADP reductase [Candidatus Kapabacteria bacterium]